MLFFKKIRSKKIILFSSMLIGLIILAFSLGYLTKGWRYKPSSEVTSNKIQKTKSKKNGKMEYGGMVGDPSVGATDPIITLTKTARKLAQIAVSPVERQVVVINTPMYGEIDYDETRLRRIAAWMPGRIDDLYVDYTGSEVEKGQAMAKIYSPDLITAQSELIESRKVLRRLDKSDLRYIKESSHETSHATWEKLRLLGITDPQIKEILDSEIPSDHLILYAPLGGTVIHLNIREGMYVNTGDSLYNIADLSNLWMICEAYESDLIWLEEGLEVEFKVETFPGEIFKGTISYIEPFVIEKTRTVRVRLQVPNPDFRLKPGMFAEAVQKKTLKDYEGKLPLVIPASAPLITGKRAVVYVAVPDKEGTFEGRVIDLGPKAGNYYIVNKGLAEGELVVTQGNFKIDSAMQIMAKPSMMNPIGEKDDDVEVNFPIVQME